MVILGITFKENCPDTRNSKVVDIINRLREYDIQPIVADPWADIEVAKQVYGVDLVPFDAIPKADCVIVAVGHNEFRALSLMQLRELFKSELSNDERVLIDVKSLYRMDELKPPACASGGCNDESDMEVPHRLFDAFHGASTAGKHSIRLAAERR